VGEFESERLYGADPMIVIPLPHSNGEVPRHTGRSGHEGSFVLRRSRTLQDNVLSLMGLSFAQPYAAFFASFLPLADTTRRFSTFISGESLLSFVSSR